jgi:glycosyltransferase involved in cell wall biosynthesis
MKIAVILCTYNRWPALAEALDSIVASKMPAEIDWRILVVDNNSTDQTREVVDQFAQRYCGRVRYLLEPKQGKSYALNTGIREADADVIAFVDDDVTVEPDWLMNLTSALDVQDWAGAGGRIYPQWASLIPPEWLPHDTRYATAPLVAFDLGGERLQLSEPPFGTNMAFKRSVFQKYGGFRIDLGPQPRSTIRGEDTEFGSRLLAAGERLRYEPEAIVHHPVPAARATKKYFLAWWFNKGRSEILQDSKFGADSRDGSLTTLFGRLSLWSVRWLIATEQAVRFECKLRVWFVAGMILERVRFLISGDVRRPEKIDGAAAVSD